MGFLDNGGDIILDAVLTDTGRARLARGDGSFKIVKFALGDDEINYGSYDKNDPSGSAFFDLEILQTPVLEAFTNNASSMKSRLLSIPRSNLLYLPVLRLNELDGATATHPSGTFIVAVDEETEALTFNNDQGVLPGANPGFKARRIRVDQGLDTTEISPAFTIDSDLLETQYTIEIDNRFGAIVDKSAGTAVQARASFIDDDDIASYFFSLNTDGNFVRENTNTNTDTTSEVIDGPRGTILEFRILSSIELNSSKFLFEQLGTTDSTLVAGETLLVIDSLIKVTGVTTGYSIEVPVRFVKKQ